MKFTLKWVLSLAATYCHLRKLVMHYDAPWSDLPEDLLVLILRKLNLADYVRCSAVCVSWKRVVTQKPPHLPTNELPWLMLSHEEEGENREFLSLSEDRVYTIYQPAFRRSRCCGSSEGWLVMESVMPGQNGFITNFLLNPFSRAHIQLPSHNYFIMKAILSSAPTPDNIASRNCIVVASIRFDASRNLAFCRPGDEKWSLFQVEEEEEYNIFYRDIIFYNRKLYALDVRDKLTVCEFNPDPKTIRVDIPSAIKRPSATSSYLVEFCGELLQILRTCPYHLGRNGFTENFFPFITSKKKEILFQFFKFDASNIRWEEVKALDLDNCALFVGKNQSISLVASKYQGLIRGKCIYFTGSKSEYGHVKCKNWYQDSALFNFDDGSVKPYFPSGRNSYDKSPPVWITPNPW